MNRPPQLRGRVPPGTLAVLAMASVSAWLIAASFVGPDLHPRYLQMVEAARAVQRAMQVVRAAKVEVDASAPPGSDPNGTGLIGPELTDIVTTLGNLGSKRTATNPDLAALFVRWFDAAGLTRGDTVVLVLSGSFPGANVAAIAAADAMGLEPVIIDSVGASTFGATDPELTWLDMHHRLVDSGILRKRPVAAVVGGVDGNGLGLTPAGIEAVRRAAARNGTPLLSTDDLESLVDELVALVRREAGNRVDLVMVVGGPAVGIGSCLELEGLTDGLSEGPVTCVGGKPGLLSRLTAEGASGIHVVNLRFLALAWGLPYDPVPLPSPGNNRAVYGAR